MGGIIFDDKKIVNCIFFQEMDEVDWGFIDAKFRTLLANPHIKIEVLVEMKKIRITSTRKGNKGFNERDKREIVDAMDKIYKAGIQFHVNIQVID